MATIVNGMEEINNQKGKKLSSSNECLKMPNPAGLGTLEIKESPPTKMTSYEKLTQRNYYLLATCAIGIPLAYPCYRDVLTLRIPNHQNPDGF